MDEINDFFDLNKNFERRALPPGLSSSSLKRWTLVSKKVSEKTVPAEQNKKCGTEYVENVAAAEKLKLDQVGILKFKI